MKRIFSALLGILLLTALAGCGGEPQSESLPTPSSSAASTPEPEPVPEPELEPEPLEQVEEQTLTLELARWEGPREGVYTGEVLNGLPQGQSSFTTQSPEGEAWSYTGEWEAGHLQGEGKESWGEIGHSYVGAFKDDLYSGAGRQYFATKCYTKESSKTTPSPVERCTTRVAPSITKGTFAMSCAWKTRRRCKRDWPTVPYTATLCDDRPGG